MISPITTITKNKNKIMPNKVSILLINPENFNHRFDYKTMILI
jgi:hypothetical protein